jgi:hypothetical protein
MNEILHVVTFDSLCIPVFKQIVYTMHENKVEKALNQLLTK